MDETSAMYDSSVQLYKRYSTLKHELIT